MEHKPSVTKLSQMLCTVGVVDERMCRVEMKFEASLGYFLGLGSSSHSCSVSGVTQTFCFDSEKEAGMCVRERKRCWITLLKIVSLWTKVFISLTFFTA